MSKIVMFLIFFSSFNVLHAKTLKVAVIDTGLDLKYSSSAKLCNSEHKDFTGEGFKDTNGHGTNIVGLITQNAKTDNYCIVLIKAYSFGKIKKTYLTEALEYAKSINANIVNLSGGGMGAIIKEREAVLKLLKSGITLVTAAGNENMNLDETCNYYPACYDSRIYVIGSTSQSSNYGKYVDIFYDGKNKTGFDVTLSGTSQSAALFTADLLNNIAKLQKSF